MRAFLLLAIGLVLTLGCTDEEEDNLGERISCGIIHIKARQSKEYCYDYGDRRYCTRVVRPTIRPGG